jgi:hypothetical protein
MPLAKMRSMGAVSVLRGGGLVHLVQALAGPELALEVLVAAAHAAQAEQLAEDHRPAGQRREQQPGHHELHHQAGVQHQVVMDRSWFMGRGQCFQHGVGNAARPQRGGIDAADADAAFGQQRAVLHQACWAGSSTKRGRHSVTCTVTSAGRPAGRAQVADLGVGDHEHGAGLVLQRLLLSDPRPSERSHSVRARSKNFR